MLNAPQANEPIPDELEWIGSFLSLGKKLTATNIDCVRNFSLLWNLFEGLVCNRGASVPKLEEITSSMKEQGNIKIDDYGEFLRYFAARYIENGEPNQRFVKLSLRKSDRSELVKSVLKGDETAPEKVLLAILIIIYRYRNNLFHGIKSIEDLPNQVENFRIANQVLMVFMEKW